MSEQKQGPLKKAGGVIVDAITHPIETTKNVTHHFVVDGGVPNGAKYGTNVDGDLTGEVVKAAGERFVVNGGVPNGAQYGTNVDGPIERHHENKKD